MRHTILQRAKITYEQLIALYGKLGSARAVAEYIGAEESVVRKYLRQNGVTLKRGCRKGQKKRKTSKLVKWCREHPEVVLPRDYKEIVELTTLSKPLIRSFFNRKDAGFFEDLSKVKIDKSLRLEDIRERVINFRFVDVYSLRGDSKSGLIYITVKAGNLKTIIKVRLERLI